MILLLLLIALTTMPSDDIAVDAVDLVEVNVIYDDQGREILSQIIFYERTPSGFRVRAWRLLKDDSQIPVGGLAIFDDGEVTRVVRARAVRFTWTQHDPEMDERSIYPKELRRPLTTSREMTTPSTADLIVNPTP